MKKELHLLGEIKKLKPPKSFRSISKNKVSLRIPHAGSEAILE